jgi:hypothetical protein
VGLAVRSVESNVDAILDGVENIHRDIKGIRPNITSVVNIKEDRLLELVSKLYIMESPFHSAG